MIDGDISAKTDVVVIGGGPGGYAAAIRASQLGLDTTLVEKDAYGGTCLNRGCIPSKALITATDVACEAGQAEEMGVYADPSIDMTEMQSWKDDVVYQLTSGVEKLCKGNDVTLVEGRAEFTSSDEVRVVSSDEGQGSRSIGFEHAIIATGSRPIQIPRFEFDGENIISSRHALELRSLPDELVVVGAGYIGMELSTVFAKLGTDVTVVEMLEHALPAYEEDIARVVRSRAEDLGVEFRFGESASHWDEVSGRVRVTTETDAGATAEYEADKVLVAVGRRPVTSTLNLEAIDLEPDENGYLPTDDQTRTGIENVFAVGDVAGNPMLAHEGMYEGKVAAEVIAGEPSALDYQAVPTVVFTDPEIATVGLTETGAKEAGFEPLVGQMPMHASGRALTMDERAGFVRVVADEETGFVLGAQIVAPEASEMIAELGLAIEMGANLADIASTVHTHPTLTEATMEAAENAMDNAIHTR
ncbi:dihydrolipoyl dehydrogenase [Natrinema sp. 1APR25-10V2]|uniref:dihydrolipoyl dehydrogenase n=1 Tax=Natrinema sp. 1APR25-10V2 TaxID=2951081 RepID=UPI0028757146|nr:dihydrolipoyl dehydrogenase [Natrinema sp. 1APR25-10V2]MDS0476941.1 dihydrolipoyl dehydrogenase [Natrinema sp. 1APR25-10V2]